MSSEQQPRRLTLEERLAEAARKKKTPKREEPSSPRTSIGGIEGNNNNNEILNIDQQPCDEILPDNYNTIAREELESLLVQHINQLLESSKDEISLLKTKLESNTSKQQQKPQRGDLEAKLKQKDAQIEELMNEGIALSKKELNLNQSIKRLKKHELELENEIEENEISINKLQSKCDLLETQIDLNQSIERSLKEEKEINDTLKQRNEALISANDGLMDELKEYKFSQFDVQLDSTKKELDEERQKSTRLEVELNKTDNDFNSFKSSKLSIINSLETDNEKLKQQLEGKIE